MMGLILKILLYMHMCPGVLSVHQLSWLPCQFIDERVTVNKDGQYESQHNRRQATLQFGQSGDSPVNPQAITFLVTGGSKLDLRRYMEGAEAKQLECELRRYSTEGIHVRWPVQQPQEYNHWFSCTIKHRERLFTATGFLRHPSDQPPPGKPDYLNWPAIADKEILTTTVAMVIKTQSPSVIARLNTQPKLHCQFALDHRNQNIMVEWYFQHRGERNKLVRYNSHSGAGDISYVLPHTKISNAGTYICSVTVDPLFVSLDVKLQIEEPPHVSINGGPTLALHRGEDFKVMCDAENYYPLDVKIVWYEQDPEVSGQSVGAPSPKPLGNVLLSSHKQKNSVYSVSGFFYLHARYMDSGKQFTCSVFHSSLRMPIEKSFILTVKEPRSLTILKLCAPLISLVGVLCMLLSYCSRKKKRSVQRKSYY